MTPKVERLVNLTVALLEARRPLTLAELKRRTGYYTQDDTDSARRMFERDKAELRSLGIPVETVAVGFGDELGYRVPRRAYELPDLDLSAAEVAAMALALQLTGADHSRLALAKLAARAPDPDPDGLAPVPRTRVELEADAVDAVADAVANRIPLRFTYRTADGREGQRRVHPHAVAQRRGAWYLIAHDLDREALRVFRLDRLIGSPRSDGAPGSFTHPDELDVAGLVAGPEGERIDVELAVDETARWEVELRGAVDTGRRLGDRAVLQLPGLDTGRELPWLLGLGAEVVVLAPEQLRDEVRAALQRVAARHREPAS